MNIEMNKVTWYSKALAAFLFVGVFALGFYLGKEYATVYDDVVGANSKPAEMVGSVKTTPTAPVPKPAVVQPKGNYAALVTMTKTGFSPASVTVTQGQTVRFVNGTDGSMRIYSNVNLGSPIYAGFDQQKSGGRGSAFDFLFNKPGTWGYHNLNAMCR